MEAHLHEWANLLTRWIHMITGIAWIGASFYFNWLENNLERQGKPAGIAGNLWAIHGGGFYFVQKYEVAPPELPETLHWFKWEAYTTWMSGFALLVIVYYLNATTTLIDPSVADLSPVEASAIGIGVLIASWFVYDGLCRSPLAQRPTLLAAVGFVLLVLLAWGLTHVFSGRGAYIHVGAAIGTCMVANVFRVIIPSQKALVHAMETGEPRDPALGRNALLRSRHNNYLTLPVLFIMISNHFPSTYGHRWNWAILAALIVISAGVRHYFNIRHLPERKVWILPVAAVAMALLAVATSPTLLNSFGGGGGANAAMGPASMERVSEVVEHRCAVCHSPNPTFQGFSSPPKGIELNTPEKIRAHRDRIAQVAVNTHIMPPGNLTKITDEERALLANWVHNSDGGEE
jgi:uncharacterized membrane protein